jgi:CTD small phosphatase-like protein 2
LPISVTFPTGETIAAGINVRPYTYECLKKAVQNYQVVVFTASHKAYADVVLDTLEKEFKKPHYLTQEEQNLINSAQNETEKKQVLTQLKSEQKLFDFRLYREHCIKSPEGIYIKDLRIMRNGDLS